METQLSRITPPVGHVRWQWSDGPPSGTPNVVTYRMADVLARLVAGDTRYVPQHVGLVYADSAESMDDPALASPARGHTYEDIATQVLAVNGNVQIVPVMSTAAFSATGLQYTGNKHTIIATSDPDAPKMFDGGGYEADPPDAGNDKIFQVLLLAQPTTGVWIPVARAPLGDDRLGELMQANQLSVFWDLEFN